MRRVGNTSTSLLIAVVSLGGSFSNAFADDVRVVRYAKQDIQKKSERDFIKPANLADRIIEKLKEIAVTATRRQAGNNTTLRDLAATNKELSKNEWARKMATLSYEPDLGRTRVNESLMGQALMAQGQKAAEMTLKRDFPIFEKFRSGMTFKLNFSESPQDTTQQIRYGLIEQDIIPNNNSIPLAAYGSFHELDQRYASRAQVIYTIDRLDQSKVESVFENREVNDHPSPTKSFNWDRLPSPKFVLKIDGGGADGSPTDQNLSGSPVGLRLKLMQSDGLISSQIVAGKSSISKTLLTEISLPLPGNFKLSQKLDHEFRLTELVFRGGLEDSLNSQLYVGYSRSSETIRGEWLFSNHDVNYGVTAETYTLPSHSMGSSQLLTHRFSFALNKNF